MNHRLVLSNLKIVELQFLVTVDEDVSCSVTLGDLPEVTPGRRMFSDLPMLDIQWEDKSYSICQIVQNNDLPTAQRNTNKYTHKQQYE